MVYDDGAEKRKPVEIATERVTIHFHPAPDGGIARVVRRELPSPTWSPSPEGFVFVHVPVEAPPDEKYEPRKKALSWVYGTPDDRDQQAPAPPNANAPHLGGRPQARTVYRYDALTGRLVSIEDVAV